MRDTLIDNLDGMECPLSYDRKISDRGDCDTSYGSGMHGTGMQTRTVVCKSSDGSTVEDSNCSETKPSTSQYCNTCTTQSSAINGSCGSANQQTYYENGPSQYELCSGGYIPPGLSGFAGGWTWSCSGTGGGVAATCIAYKSTPAATCATLYPVGSSLANNAITMSNDSSSQSYSPTVISVSDNYNGSCAVKVALIVCMRADVCGNSSQQCSRLQGGGLSFARGNETDLTLAVRAGVAVANIGYAVGTNGGVCTYSSSTSSSTCDYYHNANFSNGGFCVATITKYKS